MPPRRPAAGQPSLLDWAPPQPETAFPPELVRGATLAVRIARAVSVALNDCQVPRAEIAARMTEFLGAKVSKAMLDAYASAAREDHCISASRLMALVHATGDRRLLAMLAEPHGWSVIESRFLPLIQLAAVREREDELRREGDMLRRAARQTGLL